MLHASQTIFPSWTDLNAALSDSCRVTKVNSPNVHIHGEQGIFTALSGPDAADRQQLETFVKDTFKRAHGADIRHFMPQLMSLRDAQGTLLAVCGLRHAHESQLFLETYLHTPIEEALSASTCEQVSRQDIVEVGNLAVIQRSNIRCLLASLSVYLHGTSTKWAVFTGNPVLRNSLTKLNFPLELLGPAKLSALPEHERAGWGSYYDEQPMVMATRRREWR